MYYWMLPKWIKFYHSIFEQGKEIYMYIQYGSPALSPPFWSNDLLDMDLIIKMKAKLSKGVLFIVWLIYS